LTKEQRKLVNQLKFNIEQSVGHAKYSTQVLADHSGVEVGVIFDETKDYVKDIKEASKKIKDDLTLEDIDFKKPESKWSRYSLVKYYERAYKIARLIDKTLDDEKYAPFFVKKKDFQKIMRSVERGYHMAYRICSKLKKYEASASGDKPLKYYADRFKKLNLQRANRKLLKEEGDLKYFDDGSIWNKREQTWVKLSDRPIENIGPEYFDG
jgi:hypothetical protein